MDKINLSTIIKFNFTEYSKYLSREIFENIQVHYLDSSYNISPNMLHSVRQSILYMHTDRTGVLKEIRYYVKDEADSQQLIENIIKNKTLNCVVKMDNTFLPDTELSFLLNYADNIGILTNKKNSKEKYIIHILNPPDLRMKLDMNQLIK